MKTPVPDLAAEAGARLRAIQTDLSAVLGWKTNDDFADAIGVSRNTLSNWLTGQHPPTIHAMMRLCDAFGLTLDWIYRGRTEGLAYDKSIRLEAILEGLLPAPAPSGRGTGRGVAGGRGAPAEGPYDGKGQRKSSITETSKTRRLTKA